MKIFPAIDSILSPDHLALFVQEKYGFGEITCKVFRTGINHTYKITGSEGNYMFRVYSYNWRSEIEIQEELRIINLLKENGLPVSFPIPDKNGHYIQEVQAPEGKRYAVLFSFAEGGKIRNLTDALCFKIGELMAKMHKITSSEKVARVDYNANTLTQLPYQHASAFYRESMEEMQFVRHAGECLTSMFGNIKPGQLRSGVVHLDIWYDNMSIKNETTVTLFDFDFCGNGWLLLDIGYFMMQLFHTEPDKALFEAKSKSFYRGYEQVTKIPDEEKELIPYAGLAVWIFYLGVQSQRFDNWSNIFLTDNYLKHYIGMVKNWMDYNAIEIKVPSLET